MKKFAFLIIVAVSIVITTSSCNKRYTCAENGVATEIYYSKDYTPTQLKAIDSFCVQNGGVWEVY